MGNRAQRLSKESAVQKTAARKQATKEAKRSVQHYSELLLNQSKKSSPSANASVYQQNITPDPNPKTHQLSRADAGGGPGGGSLEQYLKIAQRQLDRAGKPMTKADLIAILLRLRPEMLEFRDSIDPLFTVSDLNAMIRITVWAADAARFPRAGAIESGDARAEIENGATL
jgi:hypothetical protein